MGGLSWEELVLNIPRVLMLAFVCGWGEAKVVQDWRGGWRGSSAWGGLRTLLGPTILGGGPMGSIFNLISTIEPECPPYL
jgi:hypothetical protein